MNRLITEDRLLDTIGIVILDEMHMIGNSYRGYILELLLTKIRFVQEKQREGEGVAMKKALHVLHKS